jgi:hypothetical protein
MSCLDVVGMVVSPGSCHALGIDVLWRDVVVVGQKRRSPAVMRMVSHFEMGVYQILSTLASRRQPYCHTAVSASFWSKGTRRHPDSAVADHAFRPMHTTSCTADA